MENEYEKDGFKATGTEAPPYDHNGVDRAIDDKEMRMGEATDIFGDAATAEEYGYVTRG